LVYEEERKERMIYAEPDTDTHSLDSQSVSQSVNVTTGNPPSVPPDAAASDATP
jgi:hypothetical protein